MTKELTIEDYKVRIENVLLEARNGQCDGGHHKAYHIDQIVRILTGCPEIRKTATAYNGKPYTYTTLGESEEYKQFVYNYKTDNGKILDEDDQYEWDAGTP